MKASELRIGNWVNHNGHPYKVVGLSHDCTTIGFVEINRGLLPKLDGYLKEDEVEGIPITPEILAKCGWIETSPLTWVHPKQRIFFLYQYIGSPLGRFTARRDYDKVAHVIRNHVDYVHELQNLNFATTGEELDINLND